MNKEIYLSNLEWIKTHDDIGGVMGNLIFKDNMSYEEYKELAKSGYFVLCNKDYITNLQQDTEMYAQLKDEYEEEIDKLTAESTEWESKCYDLQQENERLKEQNEEWTMIFDTFSKRPYAHKYLEEKKKQLGNDKIIGLDSEMVYKDYYNYKSKIEKAIEYIKQEEIEITYHELGLHWCNAKDDLLNILQGNDDK